MRFRRKQIALAAFFALSFAMAPVQAAEPLGDDAADALVAELEGASPGRSLTCELRENEVICKGARVGDCLARGWLVDHVGASCRKAFR